MQLLTIWQALAAPTWPAVNAPYLVFPAAASKPKRARKSSGKGSGKGTRKGKAARK